MDDRIVGSAAIGTEQAVLLAHRVRPDRLTGLAIKALEISADSKSKNVAGQGVTDNARPTDAGIGHIGEEDVKDTLPFFDACRGIHTDNLFSLFLRRGVVPHHCVKFAIHHDWRGACSQLGVFPNQVLTIGSPGVRQPLLS